VCWSSMLVPAALLVTERFHMLLHNL
jgi:hypothetical protein